MHFKSLILVAAIALTPFGSPLSFAAESNLAQAEAYLSAGEAEEARILFEQILENEPDSIKAHLGLGRAYYTLGLFAEALIAFETVLNLGGLPPDLLTQVDVYNEAARRYLETGDRVTRFGYAEVGVGWYRTNSTRGSTRREQNSSFLNGNLGGGFDYRLENGYAINGGLDYEFTGYEQDNVRNDSDLSWRIAGSRAVDEANVSFGLSGQNSYRGNSTFRNDYGIFGSYQSRIDPENQITIGALVRRREYQSGPLQDRSRSTATISVGWIHAINDRATTSLTAHGGRNFNTERADGKSTIWGATIDLNYNFSDQLGWYTYAWWEHDVYNTDALHFHPDEEDQIILRRDDNLYEIGTQLIWQFAQGWTLRPEILFIRDESNATNFNYSSTEVWANLRKDF